MAYPTAGLTPKAWYTLLRNAWAGEQIVTPLEAYIFSGGEPEDFTPEICRMVEHDLMILCYKKEVVSFGAYGKPAERWVRRYEWMEDDEWIDPVPFDFAEMHASVKRHFSLP